MEHRERRIERWSAAAARWVLHHRLSVVVLTLALLGPLVVHGARKLDQVDNSMHIWFEPDDPDYVYYNEFKDEFGSDELIAVAFETEDVFSPRAVEILRALVDALERIRDIEEVRSLLTSSHIEGIPDGLLIEPVLPREGDLAPAVLARAKTLALADPNLAGQLVSKDARTTVILSRIVSTENVFVKGRVTEDVKVLLGGIRAKYPDVPFYLSGAPVIDYEFDRLAERDQKTFFPLVFLCTAFVLFAIFRRASYAFIPTAVQFGVLLSTFGVFYLFNSASNMVVGMVAPILIAVSIGDSVHILARFRALRKQFPERFERLVEAVREEARPCLYTSLTTAAGFLSFLSSKVKPIRDLGLYAGVGCLAAYAITMMLIPLALSWLSDGEQPVQKAKVAPAPILRLMERLAAVTIERPRWVLAFSLLLLVVGTAGLWRLKVESSGLEFMPKNHPARVGLEFIQDHLTGLHVIEVIVETGGEGAKEPGLIRAADAFQADVEQLDNVTKSFSHANYLKQINRALHASDPAFERIPGSREEVAQYLLLAEMSGDEEISKYVSYDYAKLRVSSMAVAADSASYERIIQKVKEAIAAHFPSVKTKITGLIPLYRKLDDFLVTSQIKSFSVAFIVIFFFMWSLTGSWSLGIVAMIPNALPIALTAAVMGYSGINIDPATVLIGGVALGIAVDDTIHYLDRYRLELERSGDPEKAVRLAHRRVGPAIVFTSVILAAGFLVLLAGHFSPTRNFGVLTALTMAFAIAGDLVLLPVLLLILRPTMGATASEKSADDAASAAVQLQAG